MIDFLRRHDQDPRLFTVVLLIGLPVAYLAYLTHALLALFVGVWVVIIISIAYRATNGRHYWGRRPNSEAARRQWQAHKTVEE